MSDCTHSPEIMAALGQLRRYHPQWGWGVNKQGVICGEREGVAICSVYQLREDAQGVSLGWIATVTVWPLEACEDGEGAAADVVKAFEDARRAARVEVVK